MTRSRRRNRRSTTGTERRSPGRPGPRCSCSSTAYFVAQADGAFSTRGRLFDWTFPSDSFPDEPVIIAGLPVLAMSVAGMFAMKEQRPHLRNGRPWRDKDVRDIKIMRSMLGA